MIKNYLKEYGYLILGIIISMVIVTFFNYFGIFNTSVTNSFKLLSPIAGLFITAYAIGKKTSKRGLLEGLKYGGIFILMMLIINNLILQNNFEIKILIYYLILLTSSMMGSMIGINRHQD